MLRQFLVALALLGGPRCATPAAAQRPVRAPSLGEPCDDLDPAPLAQALERQAPLLRELSEPLRLGHRAVRPAEYAERTLLPLARLARRGKEALCRGLARGFQFFRVGQQARFTAYHHPVFRGSRSQGGGFQHPLYRRPSDEAQRHLTTAQILDGGLRDRGLELVWLDDPTAAWTAHIEGSARIELAEGGAVNLTTDGHNGWPYENVPRMVLRDGRLPKGLQAPPGWTRVRKYFADNPDELRSYWARNPHFVFFKETPFQGTGKFGELVPGRSLAVDPRYVPMGAALWIRTERPEGGGLVPLRRVGLAQDVGAAIRGAGRVDLFFGAGDEAQRAAAALNRPGEVYVLLAASPPRRVIKRGHASSLPDRARHGRLERNRLGPGKGAGEGGDARRPVRASDGGVGAPRGGDPG